jgi:CheY-like chemotaxis protein
MTALLLDSPLGEEQRSHLGMVQQSADALLAIINDILDLAKIEAGKLSLDSSRFPLRETVERAVAMLALAARRKGLEFECRVAADAPDALEGDPVRLRQVLLNLVGNALKFTGTGFIRVEAAVESREAGRVRLRFSVFDSGIGIPPEKMATIFAPFEQADRSISRSFGGTGLGLTISARLAGLMGGRIWAESVPGAGSTFHFMATFNVAAAPAAEPEADADSPGAESRSLRILVAEDNPINQKLACKILERRGHVVAVAQNGREALEAVQAANFDLVLMDVQMPEMDGLEAARTIRQRWDVQERPHVIALTAYALEGDREKCIEAGMDDYVSKPVKMEDLISILGRYRPVKQK